MGMRRISHCPVTVTHPSRTEWSIKTLNTVLIPAATYTREKNALESTSPALNVTCTPAVEEHLKRSESKPLLVNVILTGPGAKENK